MAERTGGSSSMQITTWVSVITATPAPCLCPSLPPSEPAFQGLPFFSVEPVGIVVHHVEDLVRLGVLRQTRVPAVPAAGPAGGLRRIYPDHSHRAKSRTTLAGL